MEEKYQKIIEFTLHNTKIVIKLFPQYLEIIANKDNVTYKCLIGERHRKYMNIDKNLWDLVEIIYNDRCMISRNENTLYLVLYTVSRKDKKKGTNRPKNPKFTLHRYPYINPNQEIVDDILNRNKKTVLIGNPEICGNLLEIIDIDPADFKLAKGSQPTRMSYVGTHEYYKLINDDINKNSDDDDDGDNDVLPSNHINTLMRRGICITTSWMSINNRFTNMKEHREYIDVHVFGHRDDCLDIEYFSKERIVNMFRIYMNCRLRKCQMKR